MRKTSFALAVLFALGLAPARAESLKVAVPHPNLWDSSIPNFAQREGYFKDAGLDVEWFYTEGGGAQLQTVISGSVDLGLSSGILGVVAAYAKGAPIRIIASQYIGSDVFWYVRADSPVRSLKQASGKTVGFSSAGSSSNLMLLAALRQNEVRDAKPTATGGQVTTLTQVMSGQIDIGYSAPPVGLAELRDGKIIEIGRGADIQEFRDQSVRVHVANAQALENKREAIAKFLASLQRAVDFAYSDPKAITYFMENAKISEAIARRTRDEFFPKKSLAMSRLHGLENALHDAYENKFTPRELKPADVAGLIDLSLAPKD